MIWTYEFWNMLHIVSLLINNNDKQFFIEWLLLVVEYQKDESLLQWLTNFTTEELPDICFQLRKKLDPSCPTKKYITTYYIKEFITRDIWGPVIWIWLHSIVEHVSYSFFIKQLSLLMKWLPCKECQQHAMDYIKNHTFTDNMRSWMITFHNDVTNRINIKTGKKNKLY